MPTQPAITDEYIAALVTGCQNGETTAYEQVYDVYADRLYRYLLARTADADAAADLTTEVFVRVMRSIGSFRLNRDQAAATFGGWLYRIAANLAGEYHRAKNRETWLSLDAAVERPATGADPAEMAERSEDLRHLAQAMQGLSEEQRMVLTAKFVENMSNADIAAWLGKSEGAVKSLQHRALRSLARLMRRDAAQTQATR